jgi:hypothetical protein
MIAEPVMSNQIVAIGLLTPDDLARLGEGFTRHFPVVHDEALADLLAKLDQVPAIHVQASAPVGDAKEQD